MAKRWTLHPKLHGKRGGVFLTVPGERAGRPDLAEVGVQLKAGELIDGDHWEQWKDMLVEVSEPEIPRGLNAIIETVVDVVEALIPGPLDDVILDAGEAAMKRGLAELIEKVQNGNGNGNGEDKKPVEPQSTAPAEKPKHRFRKKNQE